MRTLRALWGATHPGPALVVTALALALGLATAVDASSGTVSLGESAGRLALLVLSVFAGQLSIGLSNDAIDAGRDRAVGRRDKPVASGAVAPGTAMGVAIAAAVAALALAVPLGAGFVAAHAIFLGSAWAYNAGVKATAFSLAPFLVSFGLFPSLATLAVPSPALAPWWAAIAGAALGAAVHLTNVLPDLDDDRVTGIRGLPHRLGPRASIVLAVAGVVAGAIAVLLGPTGGDVTAVTPVAWTFFGVVLATALLTLVRALTRPLHRTLFRLVMLGALLLAVQLVATGGSLLPAP